MLYVKTQLLPSPVHGIGLFALERIPKGTEVWRFVPGFDQEFRLEELASFPPVVHDRFRNYSYISRASGTFILCADDMRFINHSDAPNIINLQHVGEQEGIDIAGRDIEAGEELFYDYAIFADPLPI